MTSMYYTLTVEEKVREILETIINEQEKNKKGFLSGDLRDKFYNPNDYGYITVRDYAMSFLFENGLTTSKICYTGKWYWPLDTHYTATKEGLNWLKRGTIFDFGTQSFMILRQSKVNLKISEDPEN